MTDGGCNRYGCEREATRYLEFLIPPTGYGMDRALKGTFGLELCRDHAEECADDPALAIDQTMLKEVAEYAARVAANSAVKPDMSRMEVRVRMIGDDNWRSFQKPLGETKQ